VLVETDRARVVGPPGATALASTVAGLVDAAVPRIAPAVGADDLSPIRVYIYLDRARFLQATGAPAHATIVGLAVMPAGAIHIDGTGRLASIASVVPHEVAHIMIARATGPALQALPRWVNEGMAEYLSDEPAARVDPAALRAVGRGEAIALSDLDAALARGDRRTELAYVEAASLVHFVVAQKGDQSLRALLGAIRQSGDFDAALKRATGWTPAQLESAWRASLCGAGAGPCSSSRRCRSSVLWSCCSSSGSRGICGEGAAGRSCPRMTGRGAPCGVARDDA